MKEPLWKNVDSNVISLDKEKELANSGSMGQHLYSSMPEREVRHQELLMQPTCSGSLFRSIAFRCPYADQRVRALVVPVTAMVLGLHLPWWLGRGAERLP